MDALSQLVIAEIARQRAAAAASNIPYGVWIAPSAHAQGGWLKNDAGRVFADLHIEIAQSAAALWGDGASVMPIDLPDADGKSALQLLEAKILEHQRAVKERKFFTRLARWFHNLIERKWLISTR